MSAVEQAIYIDLSDFLVVALNQILECRVRISF